MQISNVTLAWKIAIVKNVSIKNIVANIYVQVCIEHKTRLSYILNQLFKPLWMIWPQCVLGTPWFQVSSRKCLVLRGIYPFPLALPLDQNENWDSPYSHMNAQN